jgi:hypothetical protein
MIQVLLKIENYILSNTIGSRVRVDDDCVWEIANSVRWISQTFKEKFKIEKFLFGDIYAAYFAQASDFIQSLMEELGYDKDEKSSSSDEEEYDENGDKTLKNSKNNRRPSITSPTNILFNMKSPLGNLNSSKDAIKSPPNVPPVIFTLDSGNSTSNLMTASQSEELSCSHSYPFPTNTIIRVNSLFEDFDNTNDAAHASNSTTAGNANRDELNDSSNTNDFVGGSQTESQSLSNYYQNDDSDDILNEFKKKKT